MKVEHISGRMCPVRFLLGASVLAALTVGGAGCAPIEVIQVLHDTVKGSGKKATETRSVAPFHAIDLAGSANVDYRIGSPQSVKIETDDNLLSHVETRVANGKLTIGMKGSVSTRIGLKVTIVAPACDSAEVSGSGSMRIIGLKGSRFTATVSGSGSLTATGSSTSAAAVVTGSGNVDLSRLQTGDTEAEVTGSGDVVVAPAGQLNARITGSGNVRYLGSPKSVKKQITGSGSVVKG